MWVLPWAIPKAFCARALPGQRWGDFGIPFHKLLTSGHTMIFRGLIRDNIMCMRKKLRTKDTSTRSDAIVMDTLNAKQTLSSIAFHVIPLKIKH
ncbi:hypothetical protein PoB_006804100 [Plakobranchus ocellatus]|uniref:Secreted protein n=1 Tax=Plakobranchus ocellatus TaxID=259542 RepID=A0AAV4DC87_9GAST|nr:hypothetical protein PoB_006804100 [Plakobranchus ocellatus]